MIDGQREKVHPFRLRLWHAAGGPRRGAPQ
jgi:hypothetical protein